MIKGKSIAKYLIEAFIGLTILTVSLRVFSIPIFLISGSEPLHNILQMGVLVFAVFFAALVTYKVVRYIHKFLEIDTNSQEKSNGRNQKNI